MRKPCALFLSWILIASPSFGAFGVAAAWDVRTTGSDSNGGAFDSGVASPGTDESQGAGTAATITLVSGTTGTCSPGCTATTHGPGNFFDVASGAGCTTGPFEILSQSGGTVTLDHSMGTATDVCTGTLGGSLANFATAWNASVGGNTVWVQSGTYSYAARNLVSSAAGGIINLYGYQSSHGDWGTRPLITTATNSINLIQNHGQAYITIRNINFSSTAGSPGLGFFNDSFGSETSLTVSDSKWAGFLDAIHASISDGNILNSFNLSNVELTGCTDTNSNFGCIYLGGSPGMVAANLDTVWIHNNAGNGIYSTNMNVALTRSVVAYNGINGYQSGDYSERIYQSCLCFNTGDGFQDDDTPVIYPENSVFWGNGGWGINLISQSAVYAYSQSLHTNNAYGANTSGDRNFFLGGQGDISITAQPFVSPTTGNFTPNGTAGGGLALKAVGFPGVGVLGTGYPDIGPIQSQATVTINGILVNPGMTGGLH